MQPAHLALVVVLILAGIAEGFGLVLAVPTSSHWAIGGLVVGNLLVGLAFWLARRAQKTAFTRQSAQQQTTYRAWRELALAQASLLQTCLREWPVKDRREVIDALIAYFDKLPEVEQPTDQAAAVLQQRETLVDCFRQWGAHFQADRTKATRFGLELEETAALFTEMSQASNRYSEASVQSILASFKELNDFNTALGREIAQTLRGMVDPQNPANLSAISGETTKIIGDLELFFTDLQNLKNLSDQVMKDNLQLLGRIKDMARSIEEFASTMQMISLNVNIEASRQGLAAGGRGFQVLAKSLSEYAQKAQAISKEQQTIIEVAGKVLDTTAHNLQSQHEALSARVPSIKNRLHPFEGIVHQSSLHFEHIVKDMEGLSSSVDERLRAIIGQLQFQDLIRQELDHMVGLVVRLSDQAGQNGSAAAPEADRLVVRRDLVRDLERLASTVNELEVLARYRRERLPQESNGASTDSNLAAGSIRMF